MSKLEQIPPPETISLHEFTAALHASLVAGGMSPAQIEKDVEETVAAFRIPVRKALDNPAPDGGKQKSAA
ncbi:MAG: hypothetical protein A2V81_03760 [Candidatus Abawacabacteria bacterium RBG_16_42_10]|uniref:Uncharacterized protein n=1 Tax=Candidatus Abawacabacteria bacterium RBG_16_42_10 TaxID=1817814 RepID=A0A1F4XJT2_9BACT|nr:MAG: hypothetical protein A2V81_03760 [Candidatus Abawacabacteria bacterium RBG_16_42_10]